MCSHLFLVLFEVGRIRKPRYHNVSADNQRSMFVNDSVRDSSGAFLPNPSQHRVRT